MAIFVFAGGASSRSTSREFIKRVGEYQQGRFWKEFSNNRELATAVVEAVGPGGRGCPTAVGAGGTGWRAREPVNPGRRRLLVPPLISWRPYRLSSCLREADAGAPTVEPFVGRTGAKRAVWSL